MPIELIMMGSKQKVFDLGLATKMAQGHTNINGGDSFIYRPHDGYPFLIVRDGAVYEKRGATILGGLQVNEYELPFGAKLQRNGDKWIVVKDDLYLDFNSTWKPAPFEFPDAEDAIFAYATRFTPFTTQLTENEHGEWSDFKAQVMAEYGAQ